VRDALDRMGDEKRCAFVMVEVEGMSVKDFAAEFGLNVNTAHARLRAARREIERAVARAKKRAEVRP
jgi:DNA-directed RNA polymerase specialized sigma24 family protein